MNNLFKNTRNLTFLGLMLGITILLDSTPLGAVPLGPISATITHIPAILTGIILGPLAGLIMGTSLGLISLIHAATRPMTVLDPLFINPLISVLPRMFIGTASYYVYSLLNNVLQKARTGQSISAFAGGLAGSLTNTGLVFLMLYLVYAKQVAEKLGIAFKVLFISVATTNAITEAVLAGFISLAVAGAYFSYVKTRKQ